MKLMRYSKYAIDLVVGQMTEIFSKKTTPKRTCGSLMQAIDIIQQLQKESRFQPNDPLTLEELREMNGDPVWVKCFANPVYSGWGIRFDDFVGGYYIDHYDDRYGITWPAYRWKP